MPDALGVVVERESGHFPAHLAVLADQAGLGLMAIDREGRVQAVNQAICSMLGCEARDLAGRSEADLRHPGDRQSDAEQRAELLAGLTHSYRTEMRLLRRDETPIWVRGTFSSAAGGRPCDPLIVIVEDISAAKRLDADLRLGENGFRATFEQAAVGIAQIGLDGRWIRANDCLLEITGYTRDELEVRTVQEITHPDDLVADRGEVEGLIQGRSRHYSAEKRYIRRGGSVVWVHVTVTLVRDNAGRASYFIAVVIDISARKHAEAQLLARSTDLQGLVETAPIAVWFLHLHNSGKLHANRYASTLLGVPAAFAEPEDKGRTFRLFERGAEIAPAEYPIRCALMGREIRNREFQAVRDDGRSFLLLYNSSPLYSPQGEIIGAISTAVDMTSAKEAEFGLGEREARLQSILDTVPEALITIDDQGAIISFSRSAEELFGYTAEEVRGSNVRLLMPSPYREEHDEYLARYRRTGQKRIIGVGRAVQAQRKDGTIFSVELSVGEVRSPGRPIFTGFIRDLTAQQKIEQELRQAQKMEAVGQLTGGIAHDFNNLLTVILGNLEMLEPKLSDPRQVELLRDARETAEHGAKLTERLLAFGRRQALQPTLTDVGNLLREIAPVLRRTLGETIKVKMRLDLDVGPVVVDPTQLHNAILNIAINARDAMPKGGTLTIAGENAEIDQDYVRLHPEARPGAYVMIAATDTGVGMSRAVQERAFEPFFTTKSIGAGSGLGLSMVYGFAQQSGGHVTIYSEPGRGTTVRIYLPRMKGEMAREDERRRPTLPAPTGHGELVLVVEDETRVRRMATARLRDLGYRVLDAHDGPSALALLENEADVELLFTDMVMPGGMTGAEVARRARLIRPDLKVLFTSGYAEPDVVNQGQIGNSGWLRKPYTTAELACSLHALLDPST